MAGIKDTIVMFGSARVKQRRDAIAELSRVRATVRKGSRPTKEQIRSLRSAEIQVEMSRYYEDAVELARLLTNWTKRMTSPHRFVIASGGGPGIMEAANKGAHLAGGKSIGLNISLPYEQFANPYISKDLNFDFHYFFMRKFWFVYLSKALVVFPGGFGTMDELLEVLTLLQTNKIKKKVAVIMYGSSYWNRIIDFNELVNLGMIRREDMELVKFMNTPKEAFAYLRKFLTKTYLLNDAQQRTTLG